MTDEEINKLVATEVMGWDEVDPNDPEKPNEWKANHYKGKDMLHIFCFDWKPCTDLDQACLA